MQFNSHVCPAVKPWLFVMRYRESASQRRVSILLAPWTTAGHDGTERDDRTGIRKEEESQTKHDLMQSYHFLQNFTVISGSKGFKH